MRREILTIAFVFSCSVAYADTATYHWRGKGNGNDTQLQAAGQVCDSRYGVILDGTITSAAYKRCMLSQGWKYESTTRQRTYISPDSGMSCHVEGGIAICVPPQGTVRYFDPDQGMWCTRTGIVADCSSFQ